MHSSAQGPTARAGQPARAPSSEAARAENAQLDAQLELEAKKIALAEMRSRSQSSSEDVAQVPAQAPGRVVFEQNGKTIELTNPTAEQLRAIGLGSSSEPKVEGWMLVAMTGILVNGAVIFAALLLWHRRKTRGVRPVGDTAQADSRMERIENAIESVAEQVERISEGQRFASRVLSEGAAQPLVQAARERAGSTSGESKHA
jgi:hypothetical protein